MNWFREEHLDKVKKRFSPAKLNNISSPEVKQCLKLLKPDIEDIVFCPPENLEYLAESLATTITSFGITIDDSDIWESQSKEILSIFSYRWLKRYAHDLMAKFEITVCPYCNEQYIFTVDTRNRKCRPDFDHYYPIDKNPWLSISLANLVPSCSMCNSRCKRNKKFSTKSHIYPWLEGFEDTILFEPVILPKSLSNVIKLPVKLIPASSDTKHINRAEKNIDCFLLEERYSMHGDLVSEIQLKVISHLPVSRLLNYAKLFNLQGVGKSTIMRLLFNNFIETKDFHRRPLSKFTRDLIKYFIKLNNNKQHSTFTFP